MVQWLAMDQTSMGASSSHSLTWVPWLYPVGSCGGIIRWSYQQLSLSGVGWSSPIGILDSILLSWIHLMFLNHSDAALSYCILCMFEPFSFNACTRQKIVCRLTTFWIWQSILDEKHDDESNFVCKGTDTLRVHYLRITFCDADHCFAARASSNYCHWLCTNLVATVLQEPCGSTIVSR